MTMKNQLVCPKDRSTRLPTVLTLLAALLSLAASKASAGGVNTDKVVDAYYLLIDTSASMSEAPRPPQVPIAWKQSKIAEVKRELAQLCGNLPTEAAVRVFTFDEGPPRPGPRFDSLGDTQRAALRQYFDSLQAVGRKTYAWRGLDYVLSLAENELTSSKQIASVRVVIYTDGEDNDPSHPQLANILKKHRYLLRGSNGAVQVSYMTLGFSLSAEVRKLFATYGVQATPSLRPEDLAPLIASFSWVPEHPDSEEEVQFVDRSSGMITRYAWDFGTGGDSEEKAPVLRFAQGAYRVRLTIRSPDGRSRSVEKTLVVSGVPAVTPKFDVFPKELRPGDSVLFRNETTGPAVGFVWDFGDGNRSTNHEPSHAYARAGTYPVTLTTDGVNGKATSFTAPVRVLPLPAPKAGFVLGFDHPVAGKPVRFISQSSGVIERLEWQFSDMKSAITSAAPPGAAARSHAVVHTFKSPGTYLVRLTVSGPGGRDEAVQRIQVMHPPKPPLAPPTARFQVSRDKGILPLTVTFENRSEGNIRRFVLDFGDGSPEFTATNFVDCTHRYKSAGKYTPILRAEGFKQFPPSIYSMNAHSIVVVPPPSWLARNWWLITIGIAALLAILLCTRPIVEQRAWTSRHHRLKGILHWKPAEPKTTPWHSVKITGTDGEFAVRIPSEDSDHSIPSLILTLRKRLDATKRRANYTLDVTRDENVLATTLLQPGAERPLPVPGIIVRYDS